MSSALGPFSITLNQQVVVTIPFQPDRLQAVLVCNFSSYFLQVNGLPGCGPIWHSMLKEDLYYASGQSNVLAGSFTFFATAAASGLAINSGTGNLFVTFFEVGEEIPNHGAYPIIHSELAFIQNEVIGKLSNGVAGGTSGSGGASGSLTLTPPANAYIVVQGFDVMFDAPGAAHVCVVTLVVGDRNTMSFRAQQESSAGVEVYRTFGGGIQSEALGSVATLTIPAVSSGANWSANLWGYATYALT